METREVIIIGSGPAGYTAAIYAGRAGLKPLLFEGSITWGGALMNTTEVDNYPGFPEGILGPDLMTAMRAQAERFGAEIITDDVIAVELTKTPKTITASSSGVHLAETVIVATGASYRKLGLPSEENLSGRGVSWCATCDGFFFSGKDVAVVGGGDSAIEEALYLARFANSVTVIHRRDALRAEAIAVEKAMAEPKLTFAWNSVVSAINGENNVESVTLTDTITGQTRELIIDGLFIAIGADPSSDLVRGQLELNPDGYVVVNHPSTATSVPGVFACGDLVNFGYRQAIIAAGDGAKAAMDALAYLNSNP
ncbi:MAG: thioredoxin-disulfide reductase [Propionibacteriaceae bacterium]|nr:thioredoxin-disulfide reductase [Propionibacteriaceae bacterium]